MSNLYIGIMTGTSLDGADIALVDFSKHPGNTVAFKTYSYPKDLRKNVLSINQNQQTTISEIGNLDYKLGSFFSKVTKKFLYEFNINPDDIRAIGCHGQTIWHQPEGMFKYSMQLGNASLVANKTQIDVIADFRNADISYGGQGAPLVPAYHEYLFKKDSQRQIILNIGGISNITCLIPGQDIIGYDTGPGNILMDEWINKNLGCSYDKNGEWAKKGDVQNTVFLDYLLKDEWLKKPYPKSTGREYFNIAWLNKKIETFGSIKAENVQAALVDFTAISIADQVKKFCPDVLIVCGGGANNSYLMERLKLLNSFCDVKNCKEYNIDPDALEAAAFAWLAWRHCTKKPGNITTVTGADQPTILGALFPYTQRKLV